MKTSWENSTHLSHDEWNLINVTEIFRHKPAILKKVDSYLGELRSALAEELKDHPKPYPPDTDLTKGQIARGENHKGFPFSTFPQKNSQKRNSSLIARSSGGDTTWFFTHTERP